jgi:hypothetical protein
MPDSPFARAKQQQPTASGRTAIRANQDAEICEFESTSLVTARQISLFTVEFARFVLSNVNGFDFYSFFLLAK